MSAVAKVEESSDTMWKCENDILKDLAFLNDFGDAEPCKILYSNGRGTKIRQKEKSPEKFVDPRTGEVIDVNDPEFSYNDNLSKGKGRGRYFGNLSNKQFQLQEQLRLARPMGSGDEAMESFCRRYRTEPKTAADSTSTSDSEADSGRIRPEVSKPPGRVIGSRNSQSQSNVLISSLLSKAKDNTNAGGSTDKHSNNTEDSNSNINSNVTVKSGSILTDKDFPPLRARSKKQS